MSTTVQVKVGRGQHITEARRRLYLWELQLRQYEVGKSILLSQLAEAKSVQQQYAIASNFDPFSAVANWKRAEGVVQEKAQNARAAEQVFADLAEMPLAEQKGTHLQCRRLASVRRPLSRGELS
jgi:hypothetical protein